MALELRKARNLFGGSKKTPGRSPAPPLIEPFIFPGRSLFHDRSHAIYQVLAHVPPGLMLDVGAAAGHTAAMMLRASPESRVIAFEPFPGNHRFFEELLGKDSRVTLSPAAVSDGPGTSVFWIPSEVQGEEENWEDFSGYSSLGMLRDDTMDSGSSISVETCRLDDIIKERVRFVKIDTQGAELKVLNGAKSLLERQEIDMLFIEFDGSQDVMRHIVDLGYYIVDNECTLVNRTGAKVGRDWSVIREGKLSTGEQTMSAWPTQPITGPYAYCAWLRDERIRLGRVWTDILCVSPRFWNTFLAAAMLCDAMSPTDKQISMRGTLDKRIGPAQRIIAPMTDS